MADNDELKIRTSLEGDQPVKAGMQALLDLLGKIKDQAVALGKTDLTKQVTEFGQAFRSGAEGASSMGGMVQFLSGGISAMKTPLGIAAVGIGLMVETMKSATEVAEETFRSVRNLMAVTGENATESKALADAFKLMGMEGASMEKAMFRLSMEIEQGGKRLGAYGIAVRDVEGHLRPTGEVFEDVVTKLQGMSDAAQRNAVLMQLFGRAGRELAPIFAQGGASLEEFKNKAKELGIITQEDMDQTRELVQAKAAMNLAIEHMWNSLAKLLIPVMEAGVKVIAFFVEGLTAIIGLGTEWVKWMITSSEALDPLSLALKAVAGSIMLIYKGIMLIKSLGKWVADTIVPPVAGAGGARPEHKQTGPIITEDDINAQAKLRDAQLKVDQKYFSELKLLETGSKAEQLKVTMEYAAKLIQSERDKAAALLKLTDDPLKKDKINRDLALKEVQYAGERKLELLKIREAETEDAKKQFEEQVKAAKNAADLEVKAVQNRADETLRLIDRVDSDEKTKIQDRKTIEIGTAREIADVKKKEIDFEIAGLKTIAAANAENAVLQRETNMKLMDLAKQRAEAEMDEIKKVDKARDDAAKAEQDRQNKAAGLLGQLIKLAEDYAKSQGRKTIGAGDIEAARAQQQQQATQNLAAFFGGGQVDPAKLRQAQEFQGLQGQMRQLGVSSGDVMSAGFGQAQKTFGSDLGFEAAMQAYGRGDIAGGKAFQAQAESQGQSEVAALKGPMSKDKVDQVVESMGKKGGEVIDQMLMKIPEVTEGWFKKFSEEMIRKLEFEAART
jgi:histone H3/H4